METNAQSEVGDIIRYVFLCRIAITTGAVLFLLPLWVLSNPLLLGSVFALDGWFAHSLVFGLVLFTVWTVRLVCRMFLVYGSLRYDFHDFRRSPWYERYKYAPWLFWVAMPLPFFVAIFAYSEHSLGAVALFALVGLGFGAFFSEFPMILNDSIEKNRTLVSNVDADWLFDKDSPMFNLMERKSIDREKFRNQKVRLCASMPPR